MGIHEWIGLDWDDVRLTIWNLMDRVKGDYEMNAVLLYFWSQV